MWYFKDVKMFHEKDWNHFFTYTVVITSREWLCNLGKQTSHCTSDTKFLFHSLTNKRISQAVASREALQTMPPFWSAPYQFFYACSSSLLSSSHLPSLHFIAINIFNGWLLCIAMWVWGELRESWPDGGRWLSAGWGEVFNMPVLISTFVGRF